MFRRHTTGVFILVCAAALAVCSCPASGQEIELGLGEQSTPLIEEIAYGLNYDPLAIYNWVLTKVEYVPYYGLRQGAHVTALELQGNDYDQCVLLVSLLKQAGVPASSISYIEADVAYSAAEIYDWLKVEDLDTAALLFDGMGIPRTSSASAITVRRVLVRVVIDGAPHLLDPGFKHSSQDTPVGLAQLYPGYSATAITTQAGGSAPNDDEVSGIAVDQFQNALSTAATTYALNAADDYPGRDARSLLGLPVLNEPDRTALPTTVVQSNTTVSTWSAIPDNRAGKLRVEMGTWSRTYNWCDLADDILHVQFATDGRASLYRLTMEGAEQVEGTESGSMPTLFSFNYGLIFPQDPNTVVPNTGTPISRFGHSVLLPSFISSRGRLKRVQQSQAEEADRDPTSGRTVIHTLAALGLQREIHQQNAYAAIAGLSNWRWIGRASIWIFHERSGQLTVDGEGIYVQTYKVRSSATTPEVWADFVAAAHAWGSATENLCIEQMSSQTAASTVSVIESALRNNRKILRLRPDNWTAQMNRIEQGEAGVLPGIKSHVVTDNRRAFVPDKLQIPIYGNSTLAQGGAITAFFEAGINRWWWGGMLIEGGFSGSLGDGTGAAAAQGKNTKNAKDVKTADGQSVATGSDPVDLNSGAFLYEAPGLKLGNDAPPTSLDLRHYYSSARRLQNTAHIAPGWTHSYDLFVAPRHATDVDIRIATAAEIAPLVVALQYMRDIITSDPSAKEVALCALAANWAGRNFLKSKVTASLGERRIEFNRLPDGSYLQSSSVPATLIKGTDGTFVLSFRHGNTIYFPPVFNLHANAIVDPFGNTTSIDYDAHGRVFTVTDCYDRVLTFNYPSNALDSVTDSTGRSLSYARGTYSYVSGATPVTGTYLEITDPDGGVMKLKYSFRPGEIIRVEDARNRPIIENEEYDSFDRVWAQRPLGLDDHTTYIGYAPGQTYEADAFGNRAWTTFDARGRRTEYRDQLGRIAYWEYDGADRLVQTVSPGGAITTYGYDAYHVLVSETNPANDPRTIEPDAQHRPHIVHNFEGQQTVIDYWDSGSARIKTITAPGNIVSSYTYDAHGRVQTEHLAAYAAGQVKTYTYDDTPAGHGNLDKVTYPADTNLGDQDFDDYTFNARGDVTEFIDRKDVRTTYGYNARRQRTSVTQWEGTTARTAQTVYDPAGDIDYVIDASDRKTDFDHDALGHLLTTKRGPSSAQVTTLTNSYSDPRGLLTTSTDALGNETTYGYYATQQLATVEDPLERVTTFGYDQDGHFTTIKTPLGLAASPDYQTTTTWDSRGFKDSVEDAESHLVDYIYDKDGRLTTLANRLNKSFTWAYDDAARTVTTRTPRQQPSGPDSTRSTIETRNTRGLLLSVQEPSEQTTTFTSFDAEGRPLTWEDGVGTTTYTYWPNGLLREVAETIEGVTRTTTRTYDELNRLASYSDGEGNTISYQYHPSGELWKLTYPGNKTVTYTYDDFGRLWRVTDWLSRITTYTYDNASRLTRIDRPNGTYRTQEYDAAGQLRFIKERKADGTYLVFQEMRYDDDGRIDYLFQHPKPATVALAPDSLLYDDDNQLSTWNSQTVSFDYDGNMTNGPLPSGTFGAYGYNARNQLTSAGGAGYRYNPDGLRVEVTGTGAATFVVDPNAALSRTLIRVKGGTTTSYVYGLGLLYEETVGATKTYHFDQVGSALAITDDGQNVTDRWSYAPFGAVASRTGSTDTPFQFNGEFGVTTDLNGLLHMRARYYNPRLMRFLNADPIGFDGGLNWYAAFDNNPVSKTDPRGLKVEWDPGISSSGKVDTVAAVGYLLQSPTFTAGWDAMKASPNVYRIGTWLAPVSGSPAFFSISKVMWDPNRGLIVASSGQTQSPAMGFAHEVGHGAAHATDPQGFNNRLNQPGKNATNAEEERNTEWEKKVAQELGEPQRQNYNDAEPIPAHTNGPTCRR